MINKEYGCELEVRVGEKRKYVRHKPLKSEKEAVKASCAMYEASSEPNPETKPKRKYRKRAANTVSVPEKPMWFDKVESVTAMNGNRYSISHLRNKYAFVIHDEKGLHVIGGWCSSKKEARANAVPYTANVLMPSMPYDEILRRLAEIVDLSRIKTFYDSTGRKIGITVSSGTFRIFSDGKLLSSDSSLAAVAMRLARFLEDSQW